MGLLVASVSALRHLREGFVIQRAGHYRLVPTSPPPCRRPYPCGMRRARDGGVVDLTQSDHTPKRSSGPRAVLAPTHPENPVVRVVCPSICGQPPSAGLGLPSTALLHAADSARKASSTAACGALGCAARRPHPGSPWSPRNISRAMRRLSASAAIAPVSFASSHTPRLRRACPSRLAGVRSLATPCSIHGPPSRNAATPAALL